MTRKDRQQSLFPDIAFTCNGFITKWIVGVSKNDFVSWKPELQIWQKIGGASYTKAKSSSISNNIPTSGNYNIVKYAPNPPLEFQEGDILGVYQPYHRLSALVVYYQESDGPVNYEEGSYPLNTATLDTPGSQYDYPLVTVEISTGIPLIIIKEN